jgi:hypothetical protein
VAQLPFAVALGFDCGAECAADDLMAEAYACETDVGALGPHIYGGFVSADWDGGRGVMYL